MIGSSHRNSIAAILLVGALAAVTATAQSPRPAENITADEALACLRTATSSHAGRVEGLDVDIKGGKVICEVEIVGENGRKSEIHVDVSTNQVIGTRPD